MKDVGFLENNGVNVEKSLELFGTMEKYDETVGVFLDTIGDNVAKLREFKSIGDMKQYSRISHSIKSEAQYFGFDKLSEIALKQELSAKANEIYDVSESFDEYLAEIKKVIETVSVYLGRDPVEIGIELESSVPNGEEKILVVDDSDTIKKYVMGIFGEYYDILMAADGAEAIQIIESGVGSKIIGTFLDLNMPNIDGFEVLEYFDAKDLFAKIPVCVMTSNDTREIDARVYQYAIVGMLKKPFNERDLKIKLESLIQFRDQNRV